MSSQRLPPGARQRRSPGDAAAPHDAAAAASPPGHYRPDIDGLRAIAVLGVIFYHMGCPWLGGGFVGVDIFFVISGYLITQVSLRRVQQGSFTMGGFIERRARRILPALLVMILICMPFAQAWMLPDDLENFGQSVVASIASANNILLWITSGYFQLENEFKPLYHTWSLAIEEQFYLLFPPLLLAVLALWRQRRRRPRLLALSLVLLPILASFVIGMIGSGWIPRNGNYLLPLGRIWEIGVGGLVAWWPASTALTRLQAGFPGPLRRRLQSIPALTWRGLGLLLLLFSLVWIQPTMAFPGPVTLLPVTGTLLLLAVSPQPRRGVDRLLAQPLLVGIGLISYSLYLWHQPVLAFLRLRSLQEPGPLALAGALLLMLGLALASYRWVERPCRQASRLSRTWLLGLGLPLSGALLVAGLVLFLQAGFPGRFPELQAQGDGGISLGANAAYNDRVRGLERQDFPPGTGPTVLVVGNSFARDFVNAGLENGFFQRRPPLYLEQPLWSCRADSGDDCPQRLARSRRLLGSADILVFGSNPGRPALQQTLIWRRQDPSSGGGHRPPIVVLSAKNFGWNNNALMQLPPAERYRFHAEPLARVAANRAADRRELAGLAQVHYVDLMALLARPDGRVPVFTPDRRFISQDREHLTRPGARWVGAQLRRDRLLASLFPAPPAPRPAAGD
ncbi:MAG: acyltransferase family protein [Synechococcaceae cyanobacterium]|nr:acyltransferase family protein [Synechococcaceae cyanobacterium]